MSQEIKSKTIRLKDFDVDSNVTAHMATQVVPIDFQDNEATKRMVMHSAKRVIQQHKEEIQALAYK
ncbi:hypothetical protein [Acinetobacter rathckeae]|uniref:hypothetical protein n=1 Tax=Acinetobacter rathckeae TaxID=2605272 RepID=UPI0018A252A8|nr:hypothetical protein [Acinetobacter rathckeae]MBF7696203.1 hypothetical protein [Acinetobacter rathckeae]